MKGGVDPNSLSVSSVKIMCPDQWYCWCDIITWWHIPTSPIKQCMHKNRLIMKTRKIINYTLLIFIRAMVLRFRQRIVHEFSDRVSSFIVEHPTYSCRLRRWWSVSDFRGWQKWPWRACHAILCFGDPTFHHTLSTADHDVLWLGHTFFAQRTHWCFRGFKYYPSV